MSYKWINKKTLIGAALLATAPTVKAGDNSKTSSGSGLSEGGKSQRGVNHLTLEEAPGFLRKDETETLDRLNRQIKICVPSSTVSKTGEYHFLPDSIVVAVDPFETNVIRMTFLVSHIVAGNQDRVLVLGYSEKRTPTPPFPTPFSKKKLELDIDTFQMLGLYNVPALPQTGQGETPIGQASAEPRAKIEFDVKLSPQKISSMMNTTNDTIYVQPISSFQANYKCRSHTHNKIYHTKRLK